MFKSLTVYKLLLLAGAQPGKYARGAQTYKPKSVASMVDNGERESARACD